MKLLFGYIILTLSLAAVAASGLAATVAAKKDGVDVTAEASKDSKVIVTLKKGETVESVERKGMYWQVKTSSGKAGFVSVMSVSLKANDDDKSLSKAIRDAAKDNRADTEDATAGRARSAVMGVRGLDESGETAFAGNVKPNLRMVYSMEDRVISRKKIDELQERVSSEIEKVMEKSSP